MIKVKSSVPLPPPRPLRNAEGSVLHEVDAWGSVRLGAVVRVQRAKGATWVTYRIVRLFADEAGVVCEAEVVDVKAKRVRQFDVRKVIVREK